MIEGTQTLLSEASNSSGYTFSAGIGITVANRTFACWTQGSSGGPLPPDCSHAVKPLPAKWH